MRTRITHISFRALIPLLLFFTLVINAPELSAAPAGSTYPVQVTPMLIPPYSLYLSDYFSGTTERLSLTLTNRDLQQPQVRVKLRLTIACASGLTLTTHPQAIFDPIVLDAGVPTRLTMQELAPYFLPARLLTQGYMQGGKLTEGNVEFGFEVLEYNTGKVLSQKNIAFGNIISPKPPKLNLPINNDIVTVNEPQQLTFQWSPQYFSTGNVEYEFVIKELMDKTASPQEAFLYSREVYRTTATASAINYTMGEPTLEGNKRYAWCVRAVMHEGVETVNRFENDGYSPVSVFDMRYDCRPPTDVQATTERGTITLRWLPQPHHLKYVVSYRRTDFDANTWYTKTTTSTSINLSDIAPGQNYTYRVGAYCDDNTPVYSAPGTISVPAEDTEFLANCGKDPQIKITNRKPKGQLNVNDIIMAGDFPVTLTRVSGSNGTFTGEGSVRIPYLFANFAVRFSGIGVNEENRLISGQIETKYDKTENGIVNLDALDQGGTDGNIKSGITKANKTVEFALPEKFTMQYSEELATLTFKYETGTAIGNVDIPKNPAGKPILPLTVEDKNGNVYEVHENPEKSTSSTQPYVAVKLGKQEGEIPFGSMDLNVQDEAKATVTFANDASSLYALDTWQNYYSSVGIISGGNGDPNSNFDGCKYEKIGANYWVKWKYIPPGKTDKVTAELLIKNEAKIDPAKVVFKTKAGKVFESTYNATTHNFTITLLGGEDKDGQELYAMHPATESGKYWNLGKLDLMSYAPVERKMVLVKTSANDNTDVAVVQTELNRIYNPVGISWSVSTDNFEYDTQALFDKSSGILSAYNAQMRALNAAYTAAKGTIDTKTAYLFLVSQSSDKNNREVQGFMPRGMQFGYICNGCLTNQKLYSTIAHELGHGVFRLRHIFSTDYGSTAVGMKEKTQMLMDYADGINLPKWQWDQMYDPAILNGLFDSDKEAEIGTDNANELIKKYEEFAANYPNGLYLALHGYTCSESSSVEKFNKSNPEFPNTKILYTKTIKTANGAVTAIVFSKKDDKIQVENLILSKDELAKKLKSKFANTDNFLEFYTKQNGTIKALKKCDNWGGLKDEVCKLVKDYSDESYQLYVGHVLDQISACKAKNVMLFVNGYRGITEEPTKNLVEKFDSKNYWEGIDMLFRERRKSSYWYYADGHMGISTSNHIDELGFFNSIRSSYCARYPIGEAGMALENIVKHPIAKIVSYAVQSACASDSAESCYHKPECVILNTKPNIVGYDERSRNGRVAGSLFVKYLKDLGVAASDTLDIVCHSMGFAYAQGMIEVIKESYPDIHLGGYYILAPENACTGTVNPSDWDQIWQYGTDEDNTDKWMRDGVAPQCPIGNIGTHRAYIPETEPQGFVESHLIKNYGWIFKIKPLDPKGYVTPR